nr:hypothetical protein CFP56_59586 [Quercus suber]
MNGQSLVENDSLVLVSHLSSLQYFYASGVNFQREKEKSFRISSIAPCGKRGATRGRGGGRISFPVSPPPLLDPQS